MPCNTCYDKALCPADNLISLLFKQESLSDIDEGILGCYYIWHEFDRVQFNENRRVDFIEDLIIYGWTKDILAVAHTVYMMNTIVKQTTIILDNEVCEMIGDLCINNPYSNVIYVERMTRLWSLGRESIEEIYYLVMNPMEEDTPINIHFIESYNKTVFLLMREVSELKEVERWERDEPEDRGLDINDPAIEAWLNEDNERVDDPLPFDSPNMGRPIPVEDENLTDEQRTIQWATSLGGGADNL